MQYAVNLLLVWAGRIIFVMVLSKEYLGINGLFTNVISILSVADLGIPTAMTYALYKPLAEGDTKKIASMVTFFRKIFLVIGCAVFAAGLLLIPVLPLIVKLDREIPHLTAYYVLILLNTVVTYFFYYRTTLFTADQKSYVLQNYIIIFRLIAVALQSVVLFLFKNYFIYLATSTLVAVISNIVQNMAAFKYYPYLKEPSEPLPSDERKSIRDNVRDLFIYRICGVVQSNTDSILISLFAGTVVVGYYSNYQMMIFAVTSVITVIFTNVKASLGNLIASKDTTAEKRLEVFGTIENMNFWLTAFCSISFLCLFQSFIDISFGAEYEVPLFTVVLIVLNFYTSNSLQSIWAFRETIGMFREIRFIIAVTAVINLVLSIIMGFFWGMPGVLIATIIARMIYSWWREPMILFNKYFCCSARRYYLQYVVKVVVFALVALVSYLLCELIRLPNIYVSFALKVLFCAVVPNAVFFLILRRDKGVRDLLKRLVSFGKK